MPTVQLDRIHEKTRDKVCLVGFAASKIEAPLHDDGYELWGFNDPHEEHLFSVACFHRWFQLHSQEYMEESWKPWAQHKLMWMRQRSTPLYMQEPDERIPMSCRFPRDAIVEAFPRGWYHQSTFDWLVAFAILLGFEEIKIVGIGQMSLGIIEPLSSRAALEYWIGLAEGRGIKVDVRGHHEDLFKTYQLLETKRQYAWEESRPVIRRPPGH